MANAARLVQEIKHLLKQRGVTYKDLAGELELSESAIKQMFSSGNMTLARLDKMRHARPSPNLGRKRGLRPTIKHFDRMIRCV